jgi:hypothetical protein
MGRHPLAFGLSLAAHVGVIAAIGMTARMNADAGPHTIQLNGTRQERGAGRDVLLEVLRGDGMPIHLASTTGAATVGLAWWSPDVGLWLAVDRVPPELAGSRLQVTLQVGSAPPTLVGAMTIDDEGSGRIVAACTEARPAAGTAVALHVSRSASSRGRRSRTALLRGGAPMR